MKFFW